MLAGKMTGKALKAALFAAFGLSYMVPWAPGSADDLLPMPDVPLSDGSGIGFALSRYLGNVIVLEFWSTGCGDCLKELNALNRLQGDMPGKPVMALAVNEDPIAVSAIRAAMARQKLTFLKPFGDPNGMAAQTLGLRGLPTSFVIDRKGMIVMRIEGPQPWDSPDYEKKINFLASQPFP
jgi:thiol-disulfide isomerase/thioredoxin